MTADDIIEKTIKPIAQDGFADALEILQLIALMKAQNDNGVNKALTKKGAGRAAMAARNAFVARLTLLVSRCYAKSRDGDLHIRRAFELIASDQRVSAELKRRKSSALLNDAQTIWSRCRDDNRRQSIQHFRDKYTAHFGEPNPDIPQPKYKELFDFAIETTKAMQALAIAAGVDDHDLSDWSDEINATAIEFWRPWASEGG